MTTTVNTDPSAALAEHLRHQEAAIDEKVAGYRERLRAAQEALPDLREAAEQAELDLESAKVVARDWTAKMPNKLLLSAAQEAKTVTAARLTAASSEIAQLGKRIPCTDKTLAEVVARVIAENMPGVPVVGTYAPVNMHDRANLPAIAVVVSATAASEGPDGLMANLDVVQFRTPIYSPLGSDVIVEWLSAAGVRCRRPLAGMDYRGHDVTRIKVTAGPVHLDEDGEILAPEPTPEELASATKESEADAFDRALREAAERDRVELLAVAERANTQHLPGRS